jgi:hypothetical protein
VKSKRTKAFRDLFAALPESVQRDAEAAYRQFQVDPSHASLRFRPAQAHKDVYLLRVGLHYRALALRQPDCWIWFWIGTHAEYDKLLG